MRIVQDCAKDILPTPDEAQEAIKSLKKLMPEKDFRICNGAVGSWRMLPNGATCFYCPPIILPDVLAQAERRQSTILIK